MIAAVLGTLLIALGIGAWLAILSGPTRLAFAEVRDVMSSVSSVHVLIYANSGDDANRVEAWYQRGVGFAIHSPLGMEIDDGRSHWDYSRAQNVVVRSQSRMKGREFADVQGLGKAMGFHVDELPESLPRYPAGDRMLQEEACQAYVWNIKHDLPPKARTGLPDDMRADRRIVFLIDDAKRIRRCEHQRGLDDKWQPYRIVEISYTGKIDPGQFTASFGDDVRVVDAATPEDTQPGGELDPEVARLLAGMEKRHASYYGLKFEYLVSTEVKLAPKAKANKFDAFANGVTNGLLRTRDEFAILQPKEKSGSRPWRFWQRKVNVGIGQWALDRFVAFDGSQSNSFQSSPPRLFDREPHQGLIVPWEEPHKFKANVFDSFLFLRPNGIDDTFPLSKELGNADLKSLHLNRFHVVEKHQSAGKEIFKLRGISSHEFGVEYVVEMTGEPDFSLLRWEARYARQKGEVIASYEVKRVKSFNGVSYPALGSYRQVGREWSNDIRYDFEVISVVSLPESARATWLPPWPPSTIVSDQIKNQNFQVPPGASN